MAEKTEVEESKAPVAVMPDGKPVFDASQTLANPESFVDEVEEQILRDNISIIRGAAAFKDIDHDAEEAPKEWAEQYGEKEAAVMYRLAKAAWMPAKDAPVGLTLAVKTVTSIMKLRASKNQAPRLNVAVVVNTAAPTPVYEAVDLDEER